MLNKGRAKIWIGAKQALYVINQSGAAFREFIADQLDQIEFKYLMDDLDVWQGADIKTDVENYYYYALVYGDEMLCISHDP